MPASTPLIVSAVLERYAAAIATAQEALQDDPLYDPKRHDALWVVRFLLSHKGDVRKAVAAARATLAFREKRGLDAIRAFATSHPRSEWPGYDTAEAISPFACYQPDPDRGPYVCSRHAGDNMHILTEREGAYEEFNLHLNHLNEWVAAVCDSVTRRTGHIAKVVRLDDFAGFTMKMLSWKALRRLASTAKAAPDLYPQQVGALCAFHCLPIASMVWQIGT